MGQRPRKEVEGRRIGVDNEDGGRGFFISRGWSGVVGHGSLFLQRDHCGPDFVAERPYPK
jgi:hypothetical protein